MAIDSYICRNNVVFRCTVVLIGGLSIELERLGFCDLEELKGNESLAVYHSFRTMTFLLRNTSLVFYRKD
jgi:hypothetical protein